MKPYVDVVVVIPVGPGSSVDFVADTIQSYMHFAGASYKVIIIDDSQHGLGQILKQQMPFIDVLVSTKNMGWHCGLYINLSNAYQYALTHYNFPALLKLDTDALIIGNGPEKEALSLFTSNGIAGIAGQYPLDYDGKGWDETWPRARIYNGMETWKFIKRPLANLALRPWYKRALKNNYRPGESVFGGAYFISQKLLKTLYSLGLLPSHKFKTLNLGEDHLFSLLAKATGFSLCSLSARGLPFGCAWKGLPAHPQQLLDDNKKIIHSVRYWQQMDESAVRNFFKQARR